MVLALVLLKDCWKNYSGIFSASDKGKIAYVRLSSVNKKNKLWKWQDERNGRDLGRQKLKEIRSLKEKYHTSEVSHFRHLIYIEGTTRSII